MSKIILRLDRVMADRKVSLKELAEMVGVSNVNLSKMKTGKISAIRFSTLEAICEALNCQPGDILEYDPNADSNEVSERWGDTEAYAEYVRRGAGPEMSAGMMRIFVEFGALRFGDPAGREAQNKVRELQSFITANYYNCTDEILLGLAEMYCGDERFKKNIDAAGGEGTAEFVRKAIRIHCGAGR